MRLLLLAAVAATPLAVGAAIAAAPAGSPETRAPNTTYKPAFEGQTRVALRTTNTRFTVQTVAEGLDKPWALTFLPDGRLLVTEKPGRLRVVAANGTLSPAVTGLPAVDARGQGGLFDVELDPDYRTNQTIYWTYAEPREGGNGTAIAKGRFVDGAAPRVENVQVIFRAGPTFASQAHYGGQLAFAADKTLYMTSGERASNESRVQAQSLDSHFGKVIRINRDGTVPRDNPFVNQAGARPEIWSYGHRNPQGSAIHPTTGALWTIEHGPRGGDEVNIPQKGKNYGWPVIAYSIEYQGPKIGDGITQKAGMEQPVYYWDPVIAPGGMAFYTGSAFPAWRGSLFAGGLGSKKLVRLTLDGNRVVGEEWLLQDQNVRIRDVRQGPDGSIYVTADETAGKVLKIVPAAGQVASR